MLNTDCKELDGSNCTQSAFVIIFSSAMQEFPKEETKEYTIHARTTTKPLSQTVGLVYMNPVSPFKSIQGTSVNICKCTSACLTVTFINF